MKCKICGFDIVEGQENCPGCGTSVENLKQAGNIIIETEEVEESAVETYKEEKAQEDNYVSDSSFTNEEVISNEEVVTEEVTSNEENINVAPVSEEINEEQTIIPNEQLFNEEIMVDSNTTTDLEEVSIDSSNDNVDVSSELPSDNLEVPSSDLSIEEKVEVESTENKVENTETTPLVSPIEDSSIPKTEEFSMPTSIDEPIEEVKEEKPKKKGSSKILVFILILILIVGGLGAYVHFVYGSPKNVFVRNIDSLKTGLINDISETGNILDMELNIDFSAPSFAGISSNVIIKSDGKEGNLALDLLYKNDKLKIDGILKDKIIYVSSSLFDGNLKDKYISFDALKDTDDINYIDHKDEIKRVLSSISSSITNANIDGVYSKVYEKITIDNKEVLASKVSLELTQKQLLDFIKNVFINLKNDDQFIKDMSVLTNVSSDQILNSINSLVDQEIDEEEILDNIIIDIYTDITTTKMYFVNVGTTLKDGTDNVSINVKLEKVENDYKFVANMENANTNFKGTLTIDTNTKNINLTVNSNNEVIVANINYKFNDSKELTLPNVENSIYYSELTEDEIADLTNALLENDLFSSLLSSFIGDLQANMEDQMLIDNLDFNSEFGSDFDISM